MSIQKVTAIEAEALKLTAEGRDGPLWRLPGGGFLGPQPDGSWVLVARDAKPHKEGKAELPATSRPAFPRPGEAVDAADLLLRDLPELQQAVEGILPEGLGILAAPPKAGKSLLAYQFAVDITLGHNTLGRKSEQRPVLYYALEDGERRSKARVLSALNGRKLSRGFLLRWDAPRLGSGLEEEVSAYLDEHPGGVVIIDVLAKVRPDSGRTSLNAYDVDYGTLTAIHGVAKVHPGSVILFVTHDRKAGSDDWMTRITGTRGVSGVADFCIFINRERGKPVGTIVATGRDLEDASIPVQFTGSGWQPASMAVIVGTISQTRAAIYEYVAKAGPVWQKAIAEATGLSETVAYNRVRDMAADGQLIGTPEGYIVPPDDDPTGVP